MNSKERVLTTIAREEPDRVPVTYFGNGDIDRRLREHFGADNLDEAFGVDFRYVGAAYTGPRLHEDKGDIKVSDWGVHVRWIEHDSGGYWDYCTWPLREATFGEIEAWPMPDPDGFDYSGISEECDRLSGYCIACGGAGDPDIINGCGMLRTMEQVLIDLVSDDEAGLRLIDRRNDIKLEVLRRTFEAAGGKIDLLCLGEDLGTQRGPTMSPDLFRKHIRPRTQPYVDIAKEFGARTIIHSCGSSSWAFEDFIEMGIDAVDTLQPEAKDMSPAYLKSRFGDKLAFQGCISTAGPLAYGTVDDVAANVRETLEVMMPGGGYILAPTHCIQDNTPTENVITMYETARQFGVYGNRPGGGAQ
jgi:uroporphyrinogen decarboxylase